ncbi:MAG TPA: hypothetical protein VLT33_33960, partial [Labilithrix sp.]|nr:hypothetical protein [Labilithrix sp.]
MDKHSLPFVILAGLVATSALACSFQVGSKDPATPAPGTAPATTPATTPATPAAPKTTVSSIGKKTTTTPATPATPVNPTPATPTPAGIPVMTGTNVFGSGTVDPAGWKGSFFNLNPNTTKLPTLVSVTPNGVLFAKELNVPTKAMTGGFPGIDASRNNDFAIRWEAPLVVDTESDYTFRIVSDDGA